MRSEDPRKFTINMAELEEIMYLIGQPDTELKERRKECHNMLAMKTYGVDPNNE